MGGFILETTTILSLFAAFGLGSMLTAALQAFLADKTRSKERRFEERKSAYIGLLEAYHRAAVENTELAAKNFAYWQMRCELVAPAEVRLAISKIVETNDNPEARHIAHENLKNTLRASLEIS